MGLGLKEIHDENRRLAAAASGRPPEDCPIDGTVLQVRWDGVRNCPLGNFRWTP